MPELQQRQQLLFLYLGNSSPESEVVAWSFYDGTTDDTFEAAGEDNEPPYKTVLHAMCDGWRVLQVPALRAPQVGRDYENDYLDFEFVLEKLETING